MSAAPSNTLTSQFAWLFEGLCKVIGAEAYKRRIEAALAWAVWNRVRLLGERFLAVAARARSARLHPRSHPPTPSAQPAPVIPRPLERDGPDKRPAPPAGPSAAGLPREFGWVRRVLPETAQFAGVLAWLLRDPETAALVEVAPEAGRILRPLCRLLGVRPPEFLRREYVPACPPPPPEAEQNDRGAAVAAPAPVAAALPPAAEVPAPTPPPTPPRPRPGGLVLQGQRLVWA
jgi:hypothetical protein